MYCHMPGPLASRPVPDHAERCLYSATAQIGLVISPSLSVNDSSTDKVKWARPAVEPYRISNGSACTSSSYTPSHVIKAMGFSDDEANEAIRLSWCHLTPEVDWEAVAGRILNFK
jgi:cysteine desulfurase